MGQEPTALGTLVVGPGISGRTSVVDAQGTVVAELSGVDGGQVSLSLPPGEYRVESDGAQGPAVIGRVRVGPGGRVAVSGQAPVGTAVDLQVPPFPEDLEGPQEASMRPAPSPLEAAPPPPPAEPRRTWKRWGAPLLSAVVPGVGQMVNREGGKGAGVSRRGAGDD